MNYQPDDSLETAGALLVMVLAALGIAILAFMLMTTAAGALECKERPDSKSYWSYRIVDGDRCWYRGHGRKPKSQLEWPEKKPQREHRDPVFNQIRADAGLDAVTWHMARPFDQAAPVIPPLNLAVPDDPDVWPPLSEFEGRFVGVPP